MTWGECPPWSSLKRMTEECGQIINSSACLCSLNVENEDNHWDKLLGAYKVGGGKTKAKGILRRHQAPHCALCHLNGPSSVSQHYREHICLLFIYNGHRLGSETCTCQWLHICRLLREHKAKATESQSHFHFPHLSPTPSLLLKYHTITLFFVSLMNTL